MCFTIPRKVVKIIGETAFLEEGQQVNIDNELTVKKGDYLQVVGNVAVGRLTQKQGLTVRRLIKKLNTYEQ